MFGSEAREDVDQRLDALVRHGQQLAADIAALQAELVTVVAHIDTHQAHLGCRTATYTAWQLGFTPTEARRHVTLARTLPELPNLRAAFSAGALSEGTTALLASVATPDNEAALLATAATATGAQLQKLVAHHRRNLKPDPATNPTPPPDPGASFHWDAANGQFVGNFRFDTLDGLLADHALHVARDQLGTLTTPTGQPHEPNHTNAAALTHLFADWLSTLADSTSATIGADLHHILLHATPDHLTDADADADIDTDQSPPPAAPANPYAHHGPAITLDDLAEACCSATLAALLITSGVAVTTTTNRFATPTQRRHLLTRDQTCRYPGCGTTRNLIAHHAIPWPHGPTALENLVLLCRHHHRHVHRRQLAVTISPDGNHHFAHPTGHPVHPAPPRPPARALHQQPITTGQRLTGTGEHLTAWGTNEILGLLPESWVMRSWPMAGRG